MKFLAQLLKYLPIVTGLVPLIRSLILLAEDSGKTGAEKLAAVLAAVTDALEACGLVDADDKDAVAKVVTLVVNAVVKTFNAIGWPHAAANPAPAKPA